MNKNKPNNPYNYPYKDLLDGYAPIHPSVKFGKNVRVGKGVVMEEGCVIGDNTIIGNYVIMRPGISIGCDCVIGHLTVFEGESTIGNRVLIHAQCHITKGVIIEDDVFIAPFFCGANTPRIVHGRNYPLELKPYIIKRAARICISVSVVPGITIGENSLVGTGSVVTHDVPNGEIWYGNPARYKGRVAEDELL